MKPTIQTKEWLASIGKKGGKKTVQIHGKEHLSRAGKKGYKAMKEAMSKKLSTDKPLDRV